MSEGRSWRNRLVWSIFLALLLTVSLQWTLEERSSERATLTMRVVVQPVPQGWVPMGAMEPIRVTAEGSDRAIRRWQESPPTQPVLVDVRDPTAPEVDVPPALVPVPAGLRVVRVEPLQLAHRLERLDMRAFEVEPALTGSPPAGFEVADVAVMPVRVWARAPRSKLDTLSTARTIDIPLQGRSESFSLRVPLRAPDAYWTFYGDESGIEPVDEIQVQVRLVEQTETEEVPGVPVEVVGAEPERCRVDTRTLRVTVTLPPGTPEERTELRNALRAVIRCDALEAGVHLLPPEIINLPAGAVVQRVWPGDLTVRVAPRPQVPAPGAEASAAGSEDP